MSVTACNWLRAIGNSLAGGPTYVTIVWFQLLLDNFGEVLICSWRILVRYIRTLSVIFSSCIAVHIMVLHCGVFKVIWLADYVLPGARRVDKYGDCPHVRTATFCHCYLIVYRWTSV